MTKVFEFTSEWQERGHHSIAQYVQQFCPYRQGEKGVNGLGSYKCEKCPHCVKRNMTDHGGTVECNFDVLDLSLTYHWYDEIASGRKCEEYRKLSYHWYHRLLDHEAHEMLNRLEDAKCFRKYDGVRFHRGQGGKQTMMFECGGIYIDYGDPNRGAPEDEKVFIIKLGKRLQ